MSSSKKRETSRTELLAEIRNARERATAESRKGTRAARASYDDAKRELQLLMTSGATVRVPISAISVLEGAAESLLAEVEASPTGSSLHFETLDVDLDVAFVLQLARGADGNSSQDW